MAWMALSNVGALSFAQRPSLGAHPAYLTLPSPLLPLLSHPQAVRASAFGARRGLASQTLELSTYLEAKISAAAGAKDTSVKYAEIGSVISVGDGIARVHGLASV